MNTNNSSKWFESWFNSPYYHLLYKNRDMKEAELFVSKLFEFLKPNQAAKILDMACGKGRHSVFINKMGYDVTGIDLASESIEYALRFSNDKLRFYVHDMRSPCRINYFDYVLNLFTSFGYFDNEKDNYSVINAASKSLRMGGALVIDFMNINKVKSNLVAQEMKEVEGIAFTIKRKLTGRFITKEISFEDHGKRHFYKEKVMALTLGDFEKYLFANRLKVVHLFGNYRLDEFNEETSDRLIIVAKKQ